MLGDILRTALQSFVSIIVLFILARLMGKKQISQLTFFDYVSGISIGSIAAEFAVDNSIGYTRGITGLIIYGVFPILLSFVTLRSCFWRKILDGTPTVIIQNGKIIEKGLRDAKININDLLEECRLKNVFNIADIESAIFETNGKLSIELKASAKPMTPQDMNIAAAYQGLCLNLIIDGKILYENLEFANKDLNWLNAELKRQNINDPSDVLFAYLGSKDALNVYLKDSDTKVMPM